MTLEERKPPPIKFRREADPRLSHRSVCWRDLRWYDRPWNASRATAVFTPMNMAWCVGVLLLAAPASAAQLRLDFTLEPYPAPNVDPDVVVARVRSVSLLDERGKPQWTVPPPPAMASLVTHRPNAVAYLAQPDAPPERLGLFFVVHDKDVILYAQEHLLVFAARDGKQAPRLTRVRKDSAGWVARRASRRPPSRRSTAQRVEHDEHHFRLGDALRSEPQLGRRVRASSTTACADTTLRSTRPRKATTARRAPRASSHEALAHMSLSGTRAAMA